MSSNPLRTIILLILPVVTLALGWHLGVTMTETRLSEEIQHLEYVYEGNSGSGEFVQSNPEEEVDLSLFWTVWRLLLQKYIHPEELEIQTMLYGAIQGMVWSVGDPYSAFLPPDETEMLYTDLEGTLQGIGAELTMEGSVIRVVTPLRDSPAEGAGLLARDIIIEVDGESIEGMDIWPVIQRIRGEKGTEVTLTVLRDGEAAALTITIIRDEIIIPNVTSRVVERDERSVGVLEVRRFTDTVIDQVRTEIANLLDQDVESLVLDLRSNPGGYLDGAIELTSLFQERGSVVSVHGRDGEVLVYDVTGEPLVPSLPLAVLINTGSASSSEIVAGALQDSNRATVIGEQSYGKGSVQELVDIAGGSSLRVTIAEWHTPSGRNISEEGILPDIIVPWDQELYDESEEDVQLQATLRWLLEGIDVSVVEETIQGE